MIRYVVFFLFLSPWRPSQCLADSFSYPQKSPKNVSATAISAEMAAQLLKSAETAFLAGDFLKARNIYYRLLKSNRKDPVLRERYRQCKIKYKEAKAMEPDSPFWSAVHVGYPGHGKLKRGWRLGGLAMTTFSYPGSLGWGGQFGWMQPDPRYMALGLKLTGWYQEQPEYSNDSNYYYGSQHKTGNWGRSYSGAAQITWTPGHGRGLKTHGYFYSALGWGFVDTYVNSFDITDPYGSSRTARYSTDKIWNSGTVLSLGGGFGMKGGLDILLGITLDFWSIQRNTMVGYTMPFELFGGLGYLF